MPPCDRSPCDLPPSHLPASVLPAWRVPVWPQWRQALQRRATQRQATRQQVRALAYEITVAEARERERIASGLHDDIGQLLTLARLKLGELRATTQGPARALADEANQLVADVAKATRATTFDLCSPALQLGLQPALRGLADGLARAGGLAVQLEGELPPLPLPEPVQAVVFRVVRELCLNVQKHAQARQLSLHTQVAAQALHIVVQDDGCGLPPPAARRRFGPEGGFGLASASAQMDALGGRLHLASQPGQGTRASLWLPLAL